MLIINRRGSRESRARPTYAPQRKWPLPRPRAAPPLARIQGMAARGWLATALPAVGCDRGDTGDGGADMSKWVSVHEIKLGALYRFGARRSLEKHVLVHLMIERFGFKPAAAEQLAVHWRSTGPYRVVIEGMD